MWYGKLSYKQFHSNLENVKLQLNITYHWTVNIFCLKEQMWYKYVGSEVLTVVALKNSIFCDITPCSPVNISWLSTYYTSLYPTRQNSLIQMLEQAQQFQILKKSLPFLVIIFKQIMTFIRYFCDLAA